MERLVCAYLLSKIITGYETLLKRKSKFWVATKITSFPDSWDRYVEDELSKTESINKQLRDATAKNQPEQLRLKIELDTNSVHLSFYLECVENLKGAELLKIQLLNCLLIYAQAIRAIEVNEINIDKFLQTEDKGDQAYQKKQDRCK